VFVYEMMSHETQFSLYSPVFPRCLKRGSTSTRIIRGVSFEYRGCRGISRKIAGFLCDKLVILGATTEQRSCSGLSQRV
jgi:hypothetical protein